MRNNRFVKRAGAMLLSLVLAVGIMTGCAQKEDGAQIDASGTIIGESGKSYSGDFYENTDKDVTVTLKLDKTSYKSGDEINYILNIANNKPGYTISIVNIERANSDELKETGVPAFKQRIESGSSLAYEGNLVAFPEEEIRETPTKKTSVSGDVVTVTFRPYVETQYNGNKVMVRYKVEITMFQNKLEINSADKKRYQTVSVHDPSIVVAKDKEGKKCYYIFGSHRAWAKSYDLENWSYFSNNLSSNFSSILAEPAAWSAHGSANYKVDGFMWAPDVIYNEAMGKWCMYLSVDGDAWYSTIVLLTADTIEGDWTYEGIVVYSGFRTAEFYDETDVAEVTGETEIASRYTSKKWGDYYPNNIDACVFYDDNGKLWMSYGSWSGGIFMLELDENTGFRDLSVKYEDNIHSDPYFGKKIAGGAYVSGEASYIQKIGDYYWLFISYGNLEAKGGYNVRVFRSDKPDGDYVDALGNDAFFDSYVFNYNLSIGERLFGGYKWRSFDQGQVAQGHNSAFVDDDGKAYIVFHTRTTGGGEGHYVKVHQLFLNEDGWLVAAPYQTAGESVDPNGIDASEVPGEYDIIIHYLNIDYANYETNKAQTVRLNEDGTISGAFAGTWSLKAGTPYIDVVIDGVTYNGPIYKMPVEGSTIETIVFSGMGSSNQITIWGSKNFVTDGE